MPVYQDFRIFQGCKCCSTVVPFKSTKLRETKTPPIVINIKQLTAFANPPTFTGSCGNHWTIVLVRQNTATYSERNVRPKTGQADGQDKRLRCPLWLWVQLGAVASAEAVLAGRRVLDKVSSGKQVEAGHIPRGHG